MRGRELDGSIAESFALVGVPAFVIVGEELQDTTVASANIENPGTRRHIEANEAIGQIVLIDLEVANGGIGVADIVGLEGQPTKQFEMRELGIREINDSGRCGPERMFGVGG